MAVPPIPGYASVQAQTCGSGASNLTGDDLLTMARNLTAAQKGELAQILGYVSTYNPLDWLTFMVFLETKIVGGPLCAPLKNLVQNGGIETTIVASTDNESHGLWEPSPDDACIRNVLQIGSDVLGGCECELYPLVVGDCGTPVEQPTTIQVPMLTMPNVDHTLPNFHQGNAFQALFNKLNFFLELFTSKFPQSSPFIFLPNAVVGSVATYVPNGGDQIIRFSLQVLENPDAARINWSPPEASVAGGVQRFGKLKYQKADGKWSEVLFWNTDKQVFEFSEPSNMVVVYLNPEVVPLASYAPFSNCEVGYTDIEQSYTL